MFFMLTNLCVNHTTFRSHVSGQLPELHLWKTLWRHFFNLNNKPGVISTANCQLLVMACGMCLPTDVFCGNFFDFAVVGYGQRLMVWMVVYFRLVNWHSNLMHLAVKTLYFGLHFVYVKVTWSPAYQDSALPPTNPLTWGWSGSSRRHSDQPSPWSWAPD